MRPVSGRGHIVLSSNGVERKRHVHDFTPTLRKSRFPGVFRVWISRGHFWFSLCSGAARFGRRFSRTWSWTSSSRVTCRTNSCSSSLSSQRQCCDLSISKSFDSKQMHHDIRFLDLLVGFGSRKLTRFSTRHLCFFFPSLCCSMLLDWSVLGEGAGPTSFPARLCASFSDHKLSDFRSLLEPNC